MKQVLQIVQKRKSSADDTGTQHQQRKHQFGDLLSASLTLIPQTRASVRFLTPRAVLSLDQSFLTHWSRGRVYPPSFFLASAVSWMLCRSTGWISSLFYSLQAVGCGISLFYSLQAFGCGISLFYSLQAVGCGISLFYSLKAVGCGISLFYGRWPWYGYSSYLLHFN